MTTVRMDKEGEVWTVFEKIQHPPSNTSLECSKKRVAINSRTYCSSLLFRLATRTLSETKHSELFNHGSHLDCRRVGKCFEQHCLRSSNVVHSLHAYLEVWQPRSGFLSLSIIRVIPIEYSVNVVFQQCRVRPEEIRCEQHELERFHGRTLVRLCSGNQVLN